MDTQKYEIFTVFLLLPLCWKELIEPTWIQCTPPKNFWQIRKIIKVIYLITLPTKVHLVKDVVFSSSHVWMWELDHKVSWELKNWCFWTVVLEETLESPWDCKEIQPVNPKGDQSWIFIGRTDAEAETSILWAPDTKNWHLKRPWCWERLKVGGEGVERGWDGRMATPNEWTWVWVNSRNWWWMGKPGMLQSMGSQSVRHDWVTELIWIYLFFHSVSVSVFFSLSNKAAGCTTWKLLNTQVPFDLKNYL